MKATIIVAIFGDRTRQVAACYSSKEIEKFLSGAGRTSGSFLQPQPLGEGREVYRTTVTIPSTRCETFSLRH
jgi:hypothetical protein